MDFNRQITFIIWIYIECLPNDLFRNEYPILRHQMRFRYLGSARLISLSSSSIRVTFSLAVFCSLALSLRRCFGGTMTSQRKYRSTSWKLVSWLLWHDLRSCKTIDSPYWNKILSTKISYSLFLFAFFLGCRANSFSPTWHTFFAVHTENIPKSPSNKHSYQLKNIEYSHSLSVKLNRYVNLKPFEATMDRMAW